MALFLERLPLREVMSVPLPEVHVSFYSLASSELRLAGKKINYYEVNLRECSKEHIVDLVATLHEIDIKAFESEFGLGTADDPEEIQLILEKKDAVLFLAIDKGGVEKRPRVVGFLCGIPAQEYGLESYPDTEDHGHVLILPPADSFYLHAIAVLPEVRNRKIGFNLWRLFQKEVFPPYGKWKSLTFFAAFRKKDNQAYLLRLLERELQLGDPKEHWRVLSKGEIRTYVDEQGERRNRLIPVCYLVLDMRGKYEKELVVVPS